MGTPYYPFGLNKDVLVKDLRALADLIDNDVHIPKSVTLSTLSSAEDFVFTTLSVTYAERKN